MPCGQVTGLTISSNGYIKASESEIKGGIAMKMREGLMDFFLYENKKPRVKGSGKEKQWDWLGQYCARARFMKSFWHAEIDIKNLTVKPALQEKIQRACKSRLFAIHSNPPPGEAITVNVFRGGASSGFELVLEIDGAVNRKMVLDALEEALDQ